MIKICFTGHRPNKLGGYDWNAPKNQKIIYNLSDEIMKLLDSNEGESFHFICGGALGIDQMAFEICEKFKYTYDNITTEVALPFLKQDVKWNDLDRIKWRQQLNKANIIIEVDKLDTYRIKGYEEDIYYPAKMQKRNEYMVNNADIVIAVWETTSSGFGFELFMQYVRALREVKPKYFLYENNKSISQEIKDEITKILGVEPIMINSSLLSGQERKRMYWTNIPNVKQPEDKGIKFKDLVKTDRKWFPLLPWCKKEWGGHKAKYIKNTE